MHTNRWGSHLFQQNTPSRWKPTLESLEERTTPAALLATPAVIDVTQLVNRVVATMAVVREVSSPSAVQGVTVGTPQTGGLSTRGNGLVPAAITDNPTLAAITQATPSNPSTGTGSQPGTNPSSPSNSMAQLFTPALMGNTATGMPANPSSGSAEASTSQFAQNLSFMLRMSEGTSPFVSQDTGSAPGSVDQSPPAGLFLVGRPSPLLSMAVSGHSDQTEMIDSTVTEESTPGPNQGNEAEAPVQFKAAPQIEESRQMADLPFTLPVVMEQVLDGVMEQDFQLTTPAAWVAEHQMGSWSMGLALAGFALEAGRRNSIAEEESELRKTVALRD